MSIFGFAAAVDDCLDRNAEAAAAPVVTEDAGVQLGEVGMDHPLPVELAERGIVRRFHAAPQVRNGPTAGSDTGNPGVGLALRRCVSQMQLTATPVYVLSSGVASAQRRLLFFHSTRAGSSRRAEAYLAQVLQRGGNHDTFAFYGIAQEERPELVARFRIATLPALLVVEGNRVAGRLENARGSRQIQEFLQPWLQPPRGRQSRRE